MRQRLEFCLWTRAFVLGSLIHLTLPDYDQPGWFAPRIMHLIGCYLLWKRPTFIGFLTCTMASLWPLLMLRDVLTQSMLLTWIGAWGAIVTISRTTVQLTVVRYLTAGTYLLAALHKLNDNFFDPDISCAHHALEGVAAHWSRLDWTFVPEAYLPHLVILTELAIALLVLRRSLWVWPVGFVFHAPLTVTLAPAFGAVMFAGYAACLSANQWASLRRVWRQHPGKLIGAGLVGLTTEWSLQMDGSVSLPWIQIGLGTMLISSIVIVISQSRPFHTSKRADESLLAPRLVAIAWIIHGLTPYTGLQYQHTAAMLSNLRIDPPCHNSFVFPKSLVLADPYIRIDQARIGVGQRAARETILMEQLWSLPALYTMNRNWCIPELRPIHLRGTFRELSFDIPDLCAVDWDKDIRPNAILTGFQRFQKNLSRECRTACIH